MNLIRFIANRAWLTDDSSSKPSPTMKTLPGWYREADRFAIDPNTEEPWVGPDGGKIPTWKACPAVFDVMGTGYVLKTPCDIEFFLDENSKISVKILDPQFKDFCAPRAAMPQFVHPRGYYADHFAWWVDWGVQVPEGYSVLYTSPMNRYELPFISTSGIVDNDKVNLPGTMPFFIAEGFTGVIPAGTPYAQLLPFKREDWQSEIEINNNYEEIYNKNIENRDIYRVPNGGIYQKKVWERRVYS